MLGAWVIAFVFCTSDAPCRFHYPEPVRYYDSLAECERDVTGAPGRFNRNTMTGSEIACIKVRENSMVAERSPPVHR